MVDDKYVTSTISDDKIVEFSCTNVNSSNIIGNVYVAKVKNIVKNINSAFVEIGNNILCYYSLTDNKNHIFLNSKKNDKLVIGDEILVQVCKEGIKTKAPTVTSNISVTGKYFVITYGKKSLGMSNKLPKDNISMHIRELVSPYLSNEYGIIVRTNAYNVTDELLLNEIQLLINKLNKIIKLSKYRTVYQLVYKDDSNYLLDFNNFNHNNLELIVTDIKEIYDDIYEYLSNNDQELLPILKFHDDSTIKLTSLYNINNKLYDALKKKVWLKSGGYLVIEQTEAMVVIDVNTGKAINKKGLQEHFYNINIEAAYEIAYQLRLRNLSGIIIVDFIDMLDKSYIEKLLLLLNDILSKDRIKTTVVDMTKLNLVEITRKKIKKSLKEQMSDEEK